LINAVDKQRNTLLKQKKRLLASIADLVVNLNVNDMMDDTDNSTLPQKRLRLLSSTGMAVCSLVVVMRVRVRASDCSINE
jgi:hypothetical protein